MIIWGIKGAICIHERDSKHKIYVVLALPPDPHRGSAHGPRWGTETPRAPQLCPSNLWLLATPLTTQFISNWNRMQVSTCQ